MLNQLEPIFFGTDGWRARMDGAFHTSNVRRVSQAYAAYVLSQNGAQQGVVVGYDFRQHSENFAVLTAECLAACGIRVWLSPEACPTPAVSVAVLEKKAFGGVMITASHNPAQYNGFKIKDRYGKSAGSEVTGFVETHLDRPLSGLSDAPSTIASLDLKTLYLTRLQGAVDMARIAEQPQKVLVNCLYGSGAGVMAKAFADSKLQVVEMNATRDMHFGGINPEPLEVNVKDMQARMRQEKFDLGLIYDGDADRIGAMTPDGIFLNSQDIYVLLLWHLLQHRHMQGRVVKSFNITDRVDRLARQHGCPLQVTPIGFKQIAPFLLQPDCLIGGEESGGYGVRFYLPERDGIFCGLLLLESMAMGGKGIKALLDQAASEIGATFYHRLDVQLNAGTDPQALMAQFKNPSGMRFANLKIQSVETLDGIKYRFGDGHWILFRFSGTEPLLRIYAEGPQQEAVTLLLDEAQKLFPDVNSAS